MLAIQMGAFDSAMGGGKHRPSRRIRSAELDRAKRRASNPQFKPAWAECSCSGGGQKSCSALPHREPASNESSCICTYDRLQQTPWPCYPINTWQYDSCTACSQNGYCVPPQFAPPDAHTDEAQPCICQTITNYCIKVTNPELE